MAPDVAIYYIKAKYVLSNDLICILLLAPDVGIYDKLDKIPGYLDYDLKESIGIDFRSMGTATVHKKY